MAETYAPLRAAIIEARSQQLRMFEFIAPPLICNTTTQLWQEQQRVALPMPDMFEVLPAQSSSAPAFDDLFWCE